MEFVFRVKKCNNYSSAIESSTKAILQEMLELCEDRFPGGIRRETTASTSFVWASRCYKTTKMSQIPGKRGSIGCDRRIEKIVDIDFTEAFLECQK